MWNNFFSIFFNSGLRKENGQLKIDNVELYEKLTRVENQVVVLEQNVATLQGVVIKPPAKSKLKTIDKAALKKVIKDTTAASHVFLSDRTFQTCPLSELKRFLKANKTDLFNYEAEEFDCDDFSYRLMGQMSVPGWSHLCFGICWTKKHAFNVFYDGTDIYVVEPQNDLIIKYDDIQRERYEKFYMIVM